jgi:putative copper export protein
MDIESIVAYFICFVPFGLLMGVAMWAAWRDKDRFD